MMPVADAEVAAHWFRKAAERGHRFAQFLLGVMYAYGQGVPQDEAETVRLWRMAIEGENTWYESQGKQPPERIDVLFRQIMLYRWTACKGVLIPRTADRNRLEELEVHLWRIAAEMGDARAQRALAINYLGDDTFPPKDLVRAYAWFDHAGDEMAEAMVKALPRSMTDEQVAEAKRLSRKLAARIAAQAQ